MQQAVLDMFRDIMRIDPASVPFLSDQELAELTRKVQYCQAEFEKEQKERKRLQNNELRDARRARRSMEAKKRNN